MFKVKGIEFEGERGWSSIGHSEAQRYFSIEPTRIGKPLLKMYAAAAAASLLGLTFQG
jgi:hypothetical protein